MSRCVIISGAPGNSITFIKSCVKEGDVILCADSGYQYAKSAFLKPDIVIGDFDSCKIKLDSDVNSIKLPVAKDETDTYYCVKEAVKAGYDDFVLLAAIGGRIDHGFANISTLLYLAKQGKKGVIETETEIVRIITPGDNEFSGYKNKTFSVFPFACEDVVVSYIGEFDYPLTDATINADFPLGISNVARSDSFNIQVKSGYALVCVNRNVEDKSDV